MEKWANQSHVPDLGGEGVVQDNRSALAVGGHVSFEEGTQERRAG